MSSNTYHINTRLSRRSSLNWYVVLLELFQRATAHMQIALYAIVRSSVRLSVRRNGESVQNG